MTDHSLEVRNVLRYAGMSERSELTREERRNMAAAVRALADNPNMSSYRLYRILRPIPSDEPHNQLEK